VQVFGAVDVVAADGAVEGWRAGECDVWTEVIVASRADEAFVAGNTGLDGDAVAGAEMGDVAAGVDDDAGAFVTEDVVGGDDAAADRAGFPKVKVGAEVAVRG